jgi:hypothetical protein
MPDLQASGANPATQYLPALGPPTPPYNEDRQVTLTGGPGTQVYRTYNAHFLGSPQQWAAVDNTKPAYANVQNPDGSIHYYTLDTTTGLWDGSGNNAVYNAVDFGLTESDAVGTNNAQTLQAALNAAWADTSSTGGTVYIPPGTYQIKGTISLLYTAAPGNDHGIIIAGGSGDTELQQNGFVNLFSFIGLTSEEAFGLRTCA